MRRTILLPVTCAAVGAMMLGGCSAFENLGGGKKVSPDEFKIVSHSPLTMPPNAELRPPRPGEPRPQETTPSDQAKEALSPALAGRVQAQAKAPPSGAPGDASEQSLIAKASAGGVDPNIRSQVNTRHPRAGREGQYLHRQPDLLAGQAAAGRGPRPGEGAAAPARVRRPPASPRARRRPPSSAASAACSKASSEPDGMIGRRAAVGGLLAALRGAAAGRGAAPACCRSSAGRPRPSPLPTACRSSCCRRSARRS